MCIYEIYGNSIVDSLTSGYIRPFPRLISLSGNYPFVSIHVSNVWDIGLEENSDALYKLSFLFLLEFNKFISAYNSRSRCWFWNFPYWYYLSASLVMLSFSYCIDSERDIFEILWLGLILPKVLSLCPKL